MPDLKGKSAVVTGGTKGIGRAIAEALVGRGVDVVLSARTGADVERVAAELNEGRFLSAAAESGDRGRARGVVCDVRRPDDCRRLIEEAVSAHGGLDLLVNNAGIGIFAPVGEMSVEAWQRVIETNLNGLFYCSHYALPHLKRGGESWIINIGSLAGKNAFPRGAAYNASKFGVVGFTEALMQEVRHDGVRVSSIMPGSVATDFSHPTPGTADDWKVRPEDIAALVLELLETPARTLPSRIEVRPSRPPRK